MNSYNYLPRHKVLIVDDSEFNRNILLEILSTSYSCMVAENGRRCLDILNDRREEFDCVLLDLNMPNMSGFEVLAFMKNKGWLNTLPVIIISADNTVENTRKAFELGAVDYIERPFDSEIVKRRIKNTIQLFANQKKLAGLVLQQIKENEKTYNIMLGILGHIVEFRNKESGDHVQNVSCLTRIFLEWLNENSIHYHFNPEEITMITRASILHDVGKIGIPDNVLNKPGKLTDEEFETMKRHSSYGGEILDNLTAYKDEEIVKLATQIAKWHHERFDGKGYPDHLKGDEIPIAAQVVALADVYDALTSERCYKKAFEHDKAVNMIINNECGVFNPELIKCLKNVSPVLQEKLKNKHEAVSFKENDILNKIT